MKGSNIISAIQHLKFAEEHFADFIREHPGTKGAALFAGYVKKVQWIHKDLITHPSLPDVVREGIKREVNSDIFTIEAINEKVALLPPDLRLTTENYIDSILNERCGLQTKV